MKFIKYLLLLFSIVIIAGSIFIALKNGDYEIEESRIIKAPISVLYDNVNDYKNWLEWNPWIDSDKTIKPIFPENTSGEGASYSWTSDNGDGEMKTLIVSKDKKITQELTYSMDKNPSAIHWHFEETDQGTKVSWMMKGTSNFGKKLYWLTQGGFEKNVAPMLERGLQLLDNAVINDMNKFYITVNGVTQHSGGFYLYNTTSCKFDEIKIKTEELLGKVTTYAKEHNILVSGAPFTLYHKLDIENQTVMLSFGIPISSKITTDSGSGILTGKLDSFKALKTTLKGNYNNLQNTRQKAIKYAQQNGLEVIQGESLEAYIVGSESTSNPKNYITESYIRLK